MKCQECSGGIFRKQDFTAQYVRYVIKSCVYKLHSAKVKPNLNLFVHYRYLFVNVNCAFTNKQYKHQKGLRGVPINGLNSCKVLAGKTGAPRTTTICDNGLYS